MSALKWVRGVNGTLGWFAPKLVASKMRQAFMTPRDLPLRDWELPLLAKSERVTLRFGLSALRWGQGPAVLLMHGWEGRPTQFASLITALVDTDRARFTFRNVLASIAVTHLGSQSNQSVGETLGVGSWSPQHIENQPQSGFTAYSGQSAELIYSRFKKFGRIILHLVIFPTNILKSRVS